MVNKSLRGIWRGTAYLAAFSLAAPALSVASGQHVRTAAKPVAQPAVVEEWARGSGSSLEGKTNVERAIGKCIGSVLGGALLGGLVGAVAGNAKKGALIGTAVGAGVCAVMVKIASKRDKAALRAAQLNAVNEGKIQRTSWESSEGAQLYAVLTPSAPVPLVVSSSGSFRCRTDNRCLVGDEWVPYQTLIKPESATLQKVSDQPHVIKCRRLDTRLSVDGATSNTDSEAVCLVGDTWVTGDKLKKLNIRDDDVVTI